jgi:hypothetical protein
MKTYLTIRYNPARQGMIDCLAAEMRERQKAGQDPSELITMLQDQYGRNAFTDVIHGAMDTVNADKLKTERHVLIGALFAHRAARRHALKSQWLSRKGINDILVRVCGLRDDEVTAAWDIFRDLEKKAAEQRAQGATPQGATQYASSTVGV